MANGFSFVDYLSQDAHITNSPQIEMCTIMAIVQKRFHTPMVPARSLQNTLRGAPLHIQGGGGMEVWARF